MTPHWIEFSGELEIGAGGMAPSAPAFCYAEGLWVGCDVRGDLWCGEDAVEDEVGGGEFADGVVVGVGPGWGGGDGFPCRGSRRAGRPEGPGGLGVGCRLVEEV